MNKLIRLSKSGVQQYKSCPFSYYLLNVEKLVPEVKPAAMERGSIIHKMFEEFFATPGRTVKEKTNLYLKSNQHLSITNATPFKNFIFWVYGREKAGKDFMPHMVEKKLYDEENDIVGVVDCVIKNNEEYTLIDFKTGNAHNLADYRFELAVYAHLLKKLKGINVSKWGIFFVDHHKGPVTENVIPEMINACLNTIKEVKEKVLNKNFPKNISGRCSYCMCYMNGWCDGK